MAKKNHYTYHVNTDYQGTIMAITNQSCSLVAELSYDAWGNRRNPANWSYTGFASPLFVRGYTGHVHLEQFGLINMNGRCYDPVLGRMLSPDNYIQAPNFTQNYNRYSYCFNNPLIYTDPDGEFVIEALIIGYLLFTETGYDIQKFVSPVAVKIDINVGYNTGIGIQASIGVPQAFPISIRVDGSAGYYWSNGEIPPGWQFTYGYEIGLSPTLIVGSRYYVTPGSPEFNQKCGHIRIGMPGPNIKYENDWFFELPIGDGGDRYRTAALKIQYGPFSVGVNLFTGDPGFNWADRRVDYIQGGKGGLYQKNNKGNDPDKYRAGIGYIGLGPFRFGNNTERRRNNIQNVLIHDWLMGKGFGDPSPHFKVTDQPDRYYFQLGNGGGYLW